MPVRPAEVVAKSTTILPASADAARPVTLRRLLATLGPFALRLVAGGDDLLDRPVGEPLVYGPGEPLQDAGDAVVLLTGSNLGESGLRSCLHRLADEGGRVIVLKSWGQDLGTAAEVARDRGLTLLCTPDEMAWRHLDALLTAARLAGATVGETAAGATRGDLFSLANAIAASLGGPVTIEETSGRIMAYSNLPGQEIDEIRRLAILGRQTPDRPGNAVEYQAILHAPGPVLFESSHPAYASRMAIAVRAGHQVLGVIFVLCDRPQLVDDADRVLLDAARTTALHLLSLRGSPDPGRARRGEALRGLLAGTLDAGAASAAMALPVDGAVVLAVVRPAPGTQLRAVAAARVADLVALHGEYWHAGAVSVLDGGDLLLLLPTSGRPEGRRAHERLAARLRKLGADLSTAARRAADVELLIGFGPVVRGLDGARRSRELADRVLAVSGTGVATIEDTRTAVVLALRGAGPADDEDLRLWPVRAVLEHDAAHGTDYATTLLTYLGAFGNIVATAQALMIHENTARYRVRRLTDVFGVDFGAGDETLVMWLQLRDAVTALSPATSPAPEIGI
ncbi:transcriptional regulator [Actinoplanes sp. NBRC 101535]|nr:transcriptional regulator [Actinoplanes sp. NBRC 101535]